MPPRRFHAHRCQGMAPQKHHCYVPIGIVFHHIRSLHFDKDTYLTPHRNTPGIHKMYSSSNMHTASYLYLYNWSMSSYYPYSSVHLSMQQSYNRNALGFAASWQSFHVFPNVHTTSHHHATQWHWYNHHWSNYHCLI